MRFTRCNKFHNAANVWLMQHSIYCCCHFWGIQWWCRTGLHSDSGWVSGICLLNNVLFKQLLALVQAYFRGCAPNGFEIGWSLTLLAQRWVKLCSPLNNYIYMAELASVWYIATEKHSSEGRKCWKLKEMSYSGVKCLFASKRIMGWSKLSQGTISVIEEGYN